MQSRERSRGLTLIELLLALALGAVLLAAVFWFVSDLLATREQLRTVARREAVATALFDRIEADLGGAVASIDDAPGVVGSATALTVLSRGVVLGGSPIESLSDLQRWDYTFDSSSGLVFLARSSEAARIGEQVAFDAPLGRVELRYLSSGGASGGGSDGGDDAWMNDFDSVREGGLPRAIEIRVWFHAPAEDAVAEDETAAEFEPSGLPPDRVRLIAVPDAPAPATRSPS